MLRKFQVIFIIVLKSRTEDYSIRYVRMDAEFLCNAYLNRSFALKFNETIRFSIYTYNLLAFSFQPFAKVCFFLFSHVTAGYCPRVSGMGFCALILYCTRTNWFRYVWLTLALLFWASFLTNRYSEKEMYSLQRFYLRDFIYVIIYL